MKDGLYVPPEIKNPFEGPGGNGDDGGQAQPNGVAVPIAYVVWDAAGVWNYILAVNVGAIINVAVKD